MAVLKKICAWCGAELGTVESTAVSEHPITHGMCLMCARKILEREGDFMDDFLNELGVPLLLVKEDTSLHVMNKQAVDLIVKRLRKPQGQTLRPGELLSCIHSKAPGGCGKTVHCKSCAIRNAVFETYATGNPLVKLRSYPDVQVDDEVKTMCFEITTEKLGEFVLLRIDDLREKVKDGAPSASGGGE